MKEHTLTAEPTHSRWNRLLAARLEVESADILHVACTDASGGQVRPGSTVRDFLGIDRGRIHALTGPIAVRGAEPGDTLEIDILEVTHKGWGWTSTLEGFGFLKDRFREPSLFHWELEAAETRSLRPAVIPLQPFCGVMGVAPGVDGEFRTRPPGPFGGNMDVRELSAGAKLYLPVFNPGALFSLGDGHAAQGDGEVCINGIESPLDVSVRLTLQKGKSLSGPLIEFSERPRDSAGGAWMVVESGEDALQAARNATSRMVDLLASRTELSELHAYLLCSVAMNLKLSQVVNEPMVTVSASIAKSILPGIRLF